MNDHNAILDPQVLEELESLQMPDEPDILTELFGTFLASARPRAQKIFELCTAQNLKAISKEAHAFKSSARSIGAMRLGNVCQLIEYDPNHAIDSGPGSLQSKLQEELNLLLDEIKKIRPELF